MFGSLFLLDDRRYPSLDGLRALATLMIFNVHFFAQYAEVHYFLDPASLAYQVVRTLHSGSLGVDILFLLSGFLTHLSALSKNGPGPLAFLFHRLKRLLPVILAVNLPALCWGTDAVPFAQAVDNIFLLKVFPQTTLVNYVTWALVYEIWFYVFYALVFLFPRRFALGRWRWTWFGPLCAAYLANVMFFHRLGFLSDPRFCDFPMGIALAMLVQTPGPRATLDRLTRLVWPVALAAIVLACWVWSTPYFLKDLSPSVPRRLGFHLAFALATSIVLWRLLRPGLLSTVLSVKAVRVVGVVSFSLFMIHAQWALPISNMVLGRASSFPGLLAAWGAAFCLSALLAATLFTLLERPYFRRPAPSGASARIQALDIWRGLGVLFLFHLAFFGRHLEFATPAFDGPGPGVWLAKRVSDLLFSSSVLGVDMLFLVAGCLVARLDATDTRRGISLLSSRYAGFLPLLLVTGLPFVAYQAVGPGDFLARLALLFPTGVAAPFDRLFASANGFLLFSLLACLATMGRAADRLSSLPAVAAAAAGTLALVAFGPVGAPVNAHSLAFFWGLGSRRLARRGLVSARVAAWAWPIPVVAAMVLCRKLAFTRGQDIHFLLDGRDAMTLAMALALQACLAAGLALALTANARGPVLRPLAGLGRVSNCFFMAFSLWSFPLTRAWLPQGLDPALSLACGYVLTLGISLALAATLGPCLERFGGFAALGGRDHTGPPVRHTPAGLTQAQ